MAASTGRASHRARVTITEIVQKLCNNSSNNRLNELLEIQSLVRRSKGLDIVGEFRKQGGLDEIIKIVKSCSAVVDDVEVLDISLSVLATCCREQETKTRVYELNGIAAIVEVLKAQKSVGIINRASRSLANLASIPQISASIHLQGAVPFLVEALKETTDSNCRQSLLRTLRILTDTIQHTGDILRSEGLLAALSCLNTADDKLLACATQTAAEITKNLGSSHSTENLKNYLEAGRQAVEDNGVKLLVGLLSHSKLSIQEHSLVTLQNLMVSEGVRVAAGQASGVEIVVRYSKNTTCDAWSTYIHCLCFFCRESVNRAKVREHEGLAVLLNVLLKSTDECVRLHETVLVALMDFYHDEQSLCYLAACGFVDILADQLRQVKALHSRDRSMEKPCPKTAKKDSSQGPLTERKLSISSLEDIVGTASSRLCVKAGVQRKRVRSASGDVTKERTFEDEHVSTRKKICYAKSKSCSSNSTTSNVSCRDRQDVTASSSKIQLAASVNPKGQQVAADNVSILPPTQSEMSPESRSAEYESYINQEAAPCSPPRIDWGLYRHHREQTGQELSPRSYSSFSFSNSMSPTRGDFSASSSPCWSPQWSSNRSPNQWTSPQHSTEGSPVHSAQWSPVRSLQWSPVHSPQWGSHQSPPVPSFNSLLNSQDDLEQKQQTQTGLVTSLPEAKCLVPEAVSSSKTMEPSHLLPSKSPGTKTLKMRTGKHKTTSVSCQSSGDVSLTNSPDLNLFLESKESKGDRSTDSSKFEAHMTIRRAKEAVKLRKREYAVITLLSRYSHMDDPSSTMAKESVISSLLDYRPSLPYLLSRSRRILNRILKNRLCFEPLISDHIPMLITGKILQRERNRTSLAFSGENEPEEHTRSDRKDDFTSPTTFVADQPFEINIHDTSLDDFASDSASETTSVMSVTDSERLQLSEDTVAFTLQPLMVSSCKFRQEVLQRLLMSDSPKEMIGCVFALPYICKSKSLTKKYLIQCRGLKTLLDYLKKGNDSPELFNKAVLCLCDLSIVLGLTTASTGVTADPKSFSDCDDKGSLVDLQDVVVSQVNTCTDASNISRDFPRKPQVVTEETCVTDDALHSNRYLNDNPTSTDEKPVLPSSLSSNRPNIISKKPIVSPSCRFEAQSHHVDITFQLDNGSVVQANKTVLKQQSTFFACLLEGPFVESKQNLIPLRQISEEALLIILHVLYRCANTPCKYVTDAIQKGSGSLVEALACAGRFLLVSVQNQLCDLLTEMFIDPSTVVRLCNFGVAHDCFKLTEASLVYMLTSGRVLPKQFRDIIEGGNAVEVFKRLESLIVNAL